MPWCFLDEVKANMKSVYCNIIGMPEGKAKDELIEMFVRFAEELKTKRSST